MTAETILLDACDLLNLYGTGEIESILSHLPYRFVAGARALREAQWVRAEGEAERERVEVRPLIEAGLLAEESLQGQAETDLFIEFGLLIDDGEAETLALAVARGYSVATDDRKARRIAAERLTGAQLLGTLELLHEWQVRTGLENAAMREILRRMAFRSSYIPRRSDPLWDWWTELEALEDGR